MKFTPGPWQVIFPEGQMHQLKVSDGDMTVALCWNTLDEPDVEQIANAHLVAAAPDLYAALDFCIKRDESLKLNAVVVAALAKARG